MFNIEKGIPLTDKPLDPFLSAVDAMEPGDSFFVPEDFPKYKLVATRASARAIYHKTGAKYAQRREPGGIRLFRTA